MNHERDVAFQTIAQLGPRICAGEVSPVLLTELSLHRIQALNPTLNAFITVTRDLAMAQARAAAAEIAAGRWRGPLHGIPVAVKDFYDTAGIRTTAGFQPFERRIPTHDAVLVSALRDAGAVLVGKTNMHTLGRGTTSLDSHFGPVVNPWSAHHVAGGSSGGSAVAVAAGLCYATVDTDAIGSGRLPAAVCGVTCHKPTFGLLSPVGILAGEPVDPAILTLGHPCVTARTAEDVDLVLQAIHETPNRGSSVPTTPESRPTIRRIGIVTNFVGDDGVKAAVATVIDTLRSMAATTLVEVEAPFAAATFDLRRVDHDRATVNAVLFADLSAIVVPTLTGATPTITQARAHGEMAVSPQNTFFCNYFGLPAVSVPVTQHDRRMPTGVQFVGPQGCDREVLALAHAYQRASGWRSVPPPGSAWPEPGIAAKGAAS